MSGINPRKIQPPYSNLRAAKNMRFGAEEEILTAAGAISTVVGHTQLDITGGSNVAFTLAAGVEGQIKSIHLATKGGAGNAVITPAAAFGGTAVTLDAANERAVLMFVGGAWMSIGGIALA